MVATSSKRRIAVERGISLTPEHYLCEALKVAVDDEQRNAFHDVASVAKAYAVALREAGMVDFVDLVSAPALAVKLDRAKFSEIADRYDHVLVDEFQDLTTAMIELVVQFSMNAKSLWVVGDIRQAIYHWRGASIQGLLDFDKRFSMSRRYDLVTNRRSVKEIVDITVTFGQNHALEKSSLVPPYAVRGVAGEPPCCGQAGGGRKCGARW